MRRLYIRDWLIWVWIMPHGSTDLRFMLSPTPTAAEFWLAYLLIPSALLVVSLRAPKCHWYVLLAFSCVHFSADALAAVGVLVVGLAALLAWWGLLLLAEDLMVCYLTCYHVPGHYMHVASDSWRWVACAGALSCVAWAQLPAGRRVLSRARRAQGMGVLPVLAVGFIAAHTYVVLRT